MKLISFPVPASFYLAYLPKSVAIEGFSFDVEPIVRNFDAQLAQLRDYIKAGSIPSTFSFFVPLLLSLSPKFLSDNASMNDASVCVMQNELLKTHLRAKDVGAAYFQDDTLAILGPAQIRGQTFSTPKDISFWPRVLNYLPSNESFQNGN